LARGSTEFTVIIHDDYREITLCIPFITAVKTSFYSCEIIFLQL